MRRGTDWATKFTEKYQKSKIYPGPDTGVTGRAVQEDTALYGYSGARDPWS